MSCVLQWTSLLGSHITRPHCLLQACMPRQVGVWLIAESCPEFVIILRLDAAVCADLALMEAAVALALPAQDQQLSAVEGVHHAAPPPRVAVNTLQAGPCICSETVAIAKSISQPGSLGSAAHGERPDALWDLISAAEEKQALHAHIHDPALSTVFNATATHMAAVPGVAPGMHQSCESAEGPALSDLDLIEASEAEPSLQRASTSAAGADESLGAVSQGVPSIGEHDSCRSEHVEAATMCGSGKAGTSEVQHGEGSGAASEGMMHVPGATSVSAQPEVLIPEQATITTAPLPTANPAAAAAAEPEEPSMHPHLQPTLQNSSHAAVLTSAHASPEDGSSDLQLPEKLDTGLPSRKNPWQARAGTPPEGQDAGLSTRVAPVCEAPGAIVDADSAEADSVAPGTDSTALMHDRAQSLQHADSPPCELHSSPDPGQLPTAGSSGSHCWDEGHSSSGTAAATHQHLHTLEGHKSSGGCSDAGHSASSRGSAASSPMQAGEGRSQVSTSTPAVEESPGDCDPHNSVGDSRMDSVVLMLMQQLPGMQPCPYATGALSHKLTL